MIYDKTEADRLIVNARCADREWDAEAFNEGGTDSPEAVEIDGWNEALDTHAKPLSDQLEAAGNEIDHWRRARETAVEAGLLMQEQRDQLRAEVARMAVCKAELEDDLEREQLDHRTIVSGLDKSTANLARQVAELEQQRDRLLAGVRLVHDEVDQTDPDCPIGSALTRCGLAGCP